jgi:hypothetical protein
MLTWFFKEGHGLYALNAQQRMETVPSLLELEKLRVSERARLKQWLGERDDFWQRSAAREEEFGYANWQRLHERERIRIERRPGTDYRKVAQDIYGIGDKRAKDEDRAKEWAQEKTGELRRELGELAGRMEARLRLARNRQQAFIDALAGLICDHDYIEGMFELYSQGRYRLL